MEAAMANVAICCWIAPIQFYAQKKIDLFTEKQLVVKTCLWLSAQVAAIRSGKPLDTGLGFSRFWFVYYRFLSTGIGEVDLKRP
jgi:hypothetical protein